MRAVRFRAITTRPGSEGGADGLADEVGDQGGDATEAELSQAAADRRALGEEAHAEAEQEESTFLVVRWRSQGLRLETSPKAQQVLSR